MNILIIGANGTTGRKMVELIAKQGDHQAIAVVREENQINDLIALGASEVRLGDLTKDVSGVVSNTDVVIFAAGAGGASDELTRAVDQEGAIKVIDAAKANGIDRFLMLSSVGTEEPKGELKVYLESKAAADAHLKKADSTIRSYVLVHSATMTQQVLLKRKSILIHTKIVRCLVTMWRRCSFT